MSATSEVTRHVPDRPSWRCADCARPWPCETRRRDYLTEYAGARISLGLAMASWLAAAMSDLPQEQAGDLYLRFLGWVRQH